MKIFQKKGILSKAIERDAKNMKKIFEDIKTNTYERFYLFYGEEKYMISQMKNQLKKALVSEDDTMNYSYFEGKRADAIEIIELAKTLPFFSDHRFLILDETGLGKKSDDTFIVVHDFCTSNSNINHSTFDIIHANRITYVERLICQYSESAEHIFYSVLGC